MKKKVNITTFFIILLIPLMLVMLLVVITDPFFHYHRPLNKYYPLTDERYQNDGIVKHFDYEAMICGTSLTQNFKTSEFEKLFGLPCIKTTFAGGSFKEVDQLVKTAKENNPDLKIVVRCLDTTKLSENKDTVAYEGIPTYLYDKNPINDYEYIFNKEVVLKSFIIWYRTLSHNVTTTTFDEYAEWGSYKPTGRDSVFATYKRIEKGDYQETPFSETEKQQIYENVYQNVIETARENRDTTFYLYFPPYSICVWDGYNTTNQMRYVVESLKYAAGLLLEEENIRLYDYSIDVEMIENLDNYLDTLHYANNINSLILEYMSKDEYRLTKENYIEYYDKLLEIYSAYDYETYFAQ